MGQATYSALADTSSIDDTGGRQQSDEGREGLHCEW